MSLNCHYNVTKKTGVSKYNSDEEKLVLLIFNHFWDVKIVVLPKEMFPMEICAFEHGRTNITKDFKFCFHRKITQDV